MSFADEPLGDARLGGAVIDTNVFIAANKGEIVLPTTRIHSVLTRIELLSIATGTEDERNEIRWLLGLGTEVEIAEEIVEDAARLRRTYGGKLPDAVIAATALVYDASLATFDRGMLRYAPEVELPLLTP